jgi:hypothetical protein
MTYIERIAARIYDEVHPGERVPQEQQGLYLIYAVLALSVGEAITLENVHDAWSAWTVLTSTEHTSVRPFPELPQGTKQEDEPFRDAIGRVAHVLRS